jgi:molecular chaperone Hsp33
MSELVGSGVLAITLDPKQGNRYQGIVPLDGANLAECLTHYFEQSEQVPTFFLLFANEHQCGGMLLQCLPPQEILDSGERQELWNTVTQLASTMKADEFFESDHPTLLYRLFNELECEVFPEKPLQFKCSCSRERSSKAISSLGKTEIDDILKDGEAIDIGCHLCGKQYHFSLADIRDIAEKISTVH